MQKFNNELGIPDVDFYIMKHNTAKQERLLKIRYAIFEKNPEATERIYYGIPTIEKDGKIILQYAAYKNHISLLVGNFRLLPAFLKEKYPHLMYTEYTVVFPDKEPLPEDFLQEICGVLGQFTGEQFYAKTCGKK